MESAPVKITRYLYAAKAGSCVAIGPYSVYMRVPSELYKKLRDKYGIDIRNPRDILIEAWLAGETGEDGGDEPEVTIVYKFRRLGGYE